MNVQNAIRMLKTKGVVGAWHGLISKYRRFSAEKAISDTIKIAGTERSSEEKFSEIYRRKLWLKAGSVTGEIESVSGHGSSFRSTITFRKELEKFVFELDPDVLFDAPCGDFNWMRWVTLPEKCSYIGGDIVPSVIESNRQKYGSVNESKLLKREFQCFDITSDSFPPADIWLCKDCLQHLSLSVCPERS